MIFETERLAVRELAESDLPFVTETLTDEEIMRFWPRPYTPEEAVEWIARQQERYARDGYGYWLVLEKATGIPVGQAGLLAHTVHEKQEIGLGYIFHRPFWRRGFATEAARGCRDYAFARYNAPRVIALIRPENLPSRGVAAKLDMTPETTIVHYGFDHLVYVANRPDAPENLAS